MGSTSLMTVSGRWQRARSVNQTSTSFVLKGSTTTEPKGDAGTATGASIYMQNPNSNETQNGLKITPYGIGANAATFSMRVFGWESTTPNSNLALWTPILLCEIACTLDSTIPGVAGAEVLNTEYFCSTLAATYGNTSSSLEVCSFAAGIFSHIVVDRKGFPRVELVFSTGSSATSCNALISPI